jgi:uncharacterized protein (TIGR02145 family)
MQLLYKTFNMRVIISFFIFFSFSINNLIAQITPQGFLVSTNSDVLAIGTQIWKASNLNVINYNNGDPILNTNNFSTTVIGAYDNYNDVTANAAIYGRLYNWYAIVDARGICPVGWRVPSEDDFVILTNYLAAGIYSTSVITANAGKVGGLLKQVGFIHWTTPNTSATDAFGFSGLPGGWKQGTLYAGIELAAQFWTTTISTEVPGSPYRFTLYNDNNELRRVYSTKDFGFSVRCIKN